MSATPAHHRLDEILPEYWNKLRGTRPYPSEADIKTDVLKEIWSHCFLVKLTPNDVSKHDYHYTYLGADLANALEHDTVSKEVSARLVDPSHGFIKSHFDKVINTQKPLIEESEFTNKNGAVIKYRTCMLPLGENASSITHIIGGMNWKAF